MVGSMRRVYLGAQRRSPSRINRNNIQFGRRVPVRDAPLSSEGAIPASPRGLTTSSKRGAYRVYNTNTREYIASVC